MRNAMKIAGAVYALMLLAGCATTTAVVPMGSNTYEVAGESATGFATSGEEEVRLAQKANDYCAQRGQSAVVSDVKSRNGIYAVFWGRRASAHVTFKCVPNTQTAGTQE